MSFFKKIIDFIKRLFGGKKDPKFPKTIQELKGWGLVNLWMHIDHDHLCKTLVDNKNNATHIELLGFGADGYHEQNKWDFIFTRFESLLKAARKQAIFVTINLTNYNVGNMKYPENGPIPLSKRTDQWFRDLCKRTSDIIHKCDMSEHTAICACSEWTNNRYATWCTILEQEWNGKLLWNERSRPKSLPAGRPADRYSLEYHSINTKDIGIPNCYIVTDTGSILSEFCGAVRGHVVHLEHLKNFVNTIKSQGKGFMFYCFNDAGKGIDYNAIKFIGEANG